MRKVVLRGTIRSVVLAQQLIMDLVWEEMETAIGVMQFMIPDEVRGKQQVELASTPFVDDGSLSCPAIFLFLVQNPRESCL